MRKLEMHNYKTSNNNANFLTHVITNKSYNKMIFADDEDLTFEYVEFIFLEKQILFYLILNKNMIF